MTHEAGPIKPGKVWNKGTMPFALKEGTNEITVVLDPANLVEESNKANNHASMEVVIKDGRIVEKKVSFSSAKNVNEQGMELPEQVISAAEFGGAAADMNRPASDGTRSTELAHDDGKKIDMLSIQGSGHCVKFTRPKDCNFLTAVKIYGSRYGEYEPPAEDFHVWLCDPNLEPLKEFAFPYSQFRMRGLARWVVLGVEPTELPPEFIICVGFDPHQTKGVYVYYDEAPSGNSFTGLPGGKIEPFNKGDWMIRAVVGKGTQPMSRVRRPAQTGPPVVVKTSPEAFANDVSASLKEITVTFDQAMMDGSWSWTGGGETYPKTTGKPGYDASKKTCSLPIELEPGKVYWVGINSPSYQNFKSASGVSAKRYVILFATKNSDGKPTPIPQDLLQEARAINEQSGTGPK